MDTINRRQWLKNSLATSAGLSLLPLNVFSETDTAHTRKNQIDNNDSVRRLLYNENHLGPSKSVEDIIKQVTFRSNRYSTFYEYDANALKQLIAEQEGLKPENVLLGHGSFEPLIWTATHFGSKGEQIIVPSPTFDVIGLFARKIGANVVPVEVDSDFKMNLTEMESRINPKTSLLTLCNPNNPTGTAIETDTLKSFCRMVSDKTTILVDEAYIHFMNSWKEKSMAPLITEGKNILITRTFSKIYGLAGLRIGFMLGPESIIAEMEKKFTLGFPGNMPNSLSVASAIVSLKDDAFLETSRNNNTKIRKEFCNALDAMGLNYLGSEANFVYFDVKNFKPYKELMLKNNILLAGGWPTKPNWARVTMGSEEDISFLFDKMKGKKWL
ncbi:histidinol-phosphate aminotransferase family protein [Aquimarina sp. D1M17]|uniref:pyridoxal phosphate-dependent aminotransferase n=1 Tax=Aquimarina acroporae TaxID=2937283 RepID=UPI0020BF4B4D|nr:histidinol-phosphate transaminase [Aquimarina acroporae]MCK8523477.1 histidinol-phosphate aminotransferase family protein [Aquimarina acroporae]